MTNDVVFYTQIVSLLAYIGTMFVLYRLLVSQKDATIEALRSRCELLKEHLDHARQSTPDELVKRMAERITQLTSEMSRLSADKDTSATVIQNKQSQMVELQSEMSQLEAQMARARNLVQELACPQCGAMMLTREHQSESVEYQGRDVDVDHEFVEYECGMTVRDGEVTKNCLKK